MSPDAHGLLTGPPGSGKTRRVLDMLRQNRGGSVLLVPTATMAQHLRHQLARDGVPVRPVSIQTLSRFVASLIPDLGLVSALPLLVKKTLGSIRAPGFERVSSFPGFHDTLSSLLEELSAARCHPEDLAGLPGRYVAPVARVYADVERRLSLDGTALPGRRLEEAARRIASHGVPGLRRVLLDGFFFLSAAELELVTAISRHAAVTVTLPDWHGADFSRRTLVQAGFAEERLPARAPGVQSVVVTASGRMAETEEIARRILEFAEKGYSFRDIGILMRAADPYAPLLRTTLARFGIPARFYFAGRLGDHPACRFLAGCVEALLSGWDHDRLLEVFQLPVSGVGATREGDRLDFALRRRIPGAGLGAEWDELLAEGPPAARTLLDHLRGLDAWRAITLRPAEWAARFHDLRGLLPVPQPDDAVSHERLALWRAQACALEAYDSAVDGAAAVLGEGTPCGLAEFWEAVRDVMERAPLRPPDSRRDVVHVMDVYESRQWRLPVVFVCGLLERQFPRYPAQNPLLGDAARLALGERGFVLPTTGDREQEERFLFQWAAGRAGDHLLLSYPGFDDAGDETIPSFFLREWRDQNRPGEQTAGRVRPAPLRPRAPHPPQGIRDAALREALARRHARLSPTGIECHLQCPFQFFARKSLFLRPPLPLAGERLDALLQGRILHETLAGITGAEDAVALFERVFHTTCRMEHVPSSYRTEAVRLELLRQIRAFADDRSVALPWPRETEKSFEFMLEEGLSIRGRIDRLEIGPSGEALLIDYKYSSTERLKQQVKETGAGEKVQAGLYLLAAERCFGLHPMGVLFCGLRKTVSWNGWHVSIPGVESGTRCAPGFIAELVETARQNSREAHASILAGDIAPRPADPGKCRYCECRDICRVELAGGERSRPAAPEGSA